jgi:glyoxylase I family protein
MMQWSHVGLNCRDTTATAEFYQRWFGFLPAVPLDGQQILFLRRDDAHLELVPAAAPATAKNTGAGSESPGAIRHIAFQTDDVDAFLASMGEAADVTLGPLDFSDFINGWKTVWLRDPDGVVVEVSQGYRDENH